MLGIVGTLVNNSQAMHCGVPLGVVSHAAAILRCGLRRGYTIQPRVNALRRRDAIPLDFGIVEVLGEFVGQRLVLRHGADQRAHRFRWRRQHPVGPARCGENAILPAQIDRLAEAGIQRIGLDDFLAEHEGRIGRHVGALTHHRVDDGMHIAKRDGAFAAVEHNRGVAHRRNDAALQIILRLREIELRAINPVIGCRMMFLELVQQHVCRKRGRSCS